MIVTKIIALLFFLATVACERKIEANSYKNETALSQLRNDWWLDEPNCCGLKNDAANEHLDKCSLEESTQDVLQDVDDSENSLSRILEEVCSDEEENKFSYGWGPLGVYRTSARVVTELISEEDWEDACPALDEGEFGKDEDEDVFEVLRLGGFAPANGLYTDDEAIVTVTDLEPFNTEPTEENESEDTCPAPGNWSLNAAAHPFLTRFGPLRENDAAEWPKDYTSPSLDDQEEQETTKLVASTPWEDVMSQMSGPIGPTEETECPRTTEQSDGVPNDDEVTRNLEAVRTPPGGRFIFGERLLTIIRDSDMTVAPVQTECSQGDEKSNDNLKACLGQDLPGEHN